MSTENPRRTKTIEQILSLSPKQKILELFNHFASVETGGDAILSEEEVARILDSLTLYRKTDRGLKLFNDILLYFSKFKIALGILYQAQYRYREALNLIDRFSDLQDSYNITENLIQNIWRVVEDPHTRQQIRSIVQDQGFKFVYPAYIEAEDTFKIINLDNAIPEILEKSTAVTQTILSEYKTIYQAIDDSMTENGYTIKRFKELLADSYNNVVSRTKRNAPQPLYPDFDNTPIDQNYYNKLRAITI